MPANAKLALLPAETAEPPIARREAPPEQPQQPERPAEVPENQMPSAPEETTAPEKTSRSPRRRLVRWGFFALLPFALIAGAYWYVTGGQVMSTDDAYVQADTVGISTDVSGIVQGIDVANNQHVDPGQVLYRLDPLDDAGNVGRDANRLGLDIGVVRRHHLAADDVPVGASNQGKRQQRK